MSKLTLQDCQNYAKIKNGQCLSNEYINNAIKMLWQCKNEHIWGAAFCEIKRGKWCLQCAGKAKITIAQCQKIAQKQFGKCLSTNILNNKQKLQWQCNSAHDWWASFNSVSKGSWCPFCVSKNKKTITECVEIAKLNNGVCLSTYIKNRYHKLQWKCKNEHIWMASFANIQKGRWCPHCVNQISKPQKEIYEYLTNNYRNFNIILNDTQTIKPFDLDIYIPSLKVGIEYDGEYWHYSDWAIKNGSLDRIKRKNIKCKENDIKLIHIMENEWRENKQAVNKKMIDFIEVYNVE